MLSVRANRNEKLPLASVVVPAPLPFASTVTPCKASLVAASITEPTIVLSPVCCACKHKGESSSARSTAR